MARLTLYGPDDLVKKAKKKAIDADVSLSDAFRRFMSAWVEGKIELPPDPDTQKEQPPV